MPWCASRRSFYFVTWASLSSEGRCGTRLQEGTGAPKQRKECAPGLGTHLLKGAYMCRATHWASSPAQISPWAPDAVPLLWFVSLDSFFFCPDRHLCVVSPVLCSARLRLRVISFFFDSLATPLVALSCLHLSSISPCSWFSVLGWRLRLSGSRSPSAASEGRSSAPARRSGEVFFSHPRGMP